MVDVPEMLSPTADECFRRGQPPCKMVILASVPSKCADRVRVGLFGDGAPFAVAGSQKAPRELHTTSTPPATKTSVILKRAAPRRRPRARENCHARAAER